LTAENQSSVAERPAGDWRSLRALLPFVRRYRWPVAGAAVFLAISAAAALVLPLAVRQVIDEGFGAASAAHIDRWFWLLFAAAAVMAVSGGLRHYWVSWLGQRVVTDLRRAVYDRVIRMSPEFFERTPSGEVLSRLNTDTTLVESLVGSSASFAVRHLVILLACAVMLPVTSPRLAGVMAIVIPLVLVPTVLLARRVRRLSRASQDRVADFSALGTETIEGVHTVQAMTQEPRESARFAEAAEQAFVANRSRIRISTMLIITVITLTFAGIVFVLWLGARAVLAGEMTPGLLSQFVLYAVMAAGAVAGLGEIWGSVQRAAGALERLTELLGLQASIRAPERPAALDTAGGVAVAFEQVRFSYPSRPERPALDEIGFRVDAGQTVALVGPSGAGKSTIFQLLMRFYDPDGGRILINGLDLRHLDPRRLRAGMALVPQQTTIFSDSAANNIRYGRPDATDAEVQAAAASAQAHEFIAEMPQGYDTYVGERGLRLSGGQRQRIAIARAVLMDPPLLLLDEATSSLDAESEARVQQAIDALRRDRTVLVIAHRLATVRKADRILVLDRGRLVAEGDHDALMGQSDLYARLARLQFAA